MRHMVFFVLVVFGLGGCSTPYKKDGFAGGYTDIELGQNKYLVRFAGNGYTSFTREKEFAIRRAKEVCTEKQMDFEILQIAEKEAEVTVQCKARQG